ncbi:MAG: TrkA C-terminal domain-containing protein, partial [Planctomycetota bacterium]
ALRHTSLDLRDYANLLNLSEGFTVAEIPVRSRDWLAGKRLWEANLLGEGVVVLAIRRENGDYVGVPTGNDLICAGDLLVVYGQDQRVDSIQKRERGASGEAGHMEAVEKESERLRRQEIREQRRERDQRAQQT